ncbi:MAG TPA: hypothetical protein VF140_00480 [Phycicoccus sp.]
MSTRISRRTVATGAAWSVPVLVVSAAAPAMAASGCTAVTAVAGTHTNGSANVAMTVTFGVSGSVCVTGLTATGGSNTGATITYAGPAVCGTTTVAFTATANNSGSNVRGPYTGTITYTVGGQTCTQAVSFSVTA